MALIQCRNCGSDVSDKAVVCPHCGEKLIEEIKEKIFCEDCGTEVPEEAESCPNCGCPVAKEAVGSQKVEITGVKIKNSPKTKKYIIISVVAILIIALIAVVGSVSAKNKAIREAEEQAEKERIAYEETIKSYEQTVKYATTTMLKGAAEAENAGNLVKKVWYNAINKEKDKSTNPYTTKDGKGYSFYDFNTALNNLYSDANFKHKIESIESNQNIVKSSMKTLTNPPAECKEMYAAVKELYDAYLDLTNLVINPSGSYNTYSENFNNADTRVVKCYESMGIYID